MKATAHKTDERKMKMKKQNTNPYQTNKGGQIIAPRKQADEPRVSRIVGDDLRLKRGKAGRGK